MTPQSGSNLLQIAYAAYACPETIEDSVVARVTSLLSQPGVPPQTFEMVETVLKALLATPLAQAALDGSIASLRDPGLCPAAVQVLLNVLQHAAEWARTLLDPPTIVSLVELEHLRSYRDWLLRGVVEPCFYAAGDSVTTGLLERAFRLYRTTDAPYFLYYVSQWKQFSVEVRAAAAGLISGRFLFHRDVAQRLGGQGRRILIVQNIKDGQGDEMIRCVPLIQALLDFNPRLDVRLITQRGYLYAHPRVTKVPISNEERVDSALSEAFDGVIDFFEPNIVELNHNRALEAKVQEYIKTNQPFLFASSLKGFNRFVFERVDLDGRPLAESIGLNAQRVPNIYETTCRLIAELGLPLRSGEDVPESGWVIAGSEWPEAKASWRSLIRRNTAARPVALMNPFGGVEPLKGFVDRNLNLLAAEIERLIGEGYFVILVPNGTPWGGAAQAREAVGRVAADRRIHLEVASDPAGDSGTVAASLSGIPEMPYADYVMRQFTWFVRFADLIVTVEGWMMHVAWFLGKPYRVMMLPYSHSSEWHPYTRTRRQDVQRLYGSGVDDDGPLPEQPRKLTWIALLREFGRTKTPDALSLVRKSARSQDREIRRAAAESLSKFSEAEVERDLIELLQDRFGGVRAAAAKGLLDRSDARMKVPKAELMAHIYIGQENRDWRSIAKLRDGAIPAIQTALKDEDPVVRREAADMIKGLDEAMFQRMRNHVHRLRKDAGSS